MGVFSFLRGDSILDQKALTGSASVLEAISSRTFSPYPSLGGTNINTQRIGSAYVSVQSASYGWLYVYQPSVRRVVDYVARNIAELGTKVFERISDTEREHRGDHPAAETLRNPNGHQTGAYFIQEFVKTHLVYGNSYCLKFPGPNGTLILELVPPPRVGIIGQSAFTPDGFRIYRPDGTAFDVPPERMIHWPASSGDDPRRGESCLETLRQLLAADAAAQQAVNEVHLSGFALKGWLERPLESPEISDDGLKRLEQSLSNRLKQGKSHIPIFEEGMQFKTGSMTPEDAELMASRSFAQDLVASCFGMKNIPPIGDEERNQFYADVLAPLTTMCASVFDLHILKREYGAEDFYVEFNPEKLQAEWLKTLTSASGRPVMTTNEARAKINLPPIEGGDEIVTPANVFVGENPRPSPQVMPIQNPNGPPQDGSHRTDDVPVPAGRSSLNLSHRTGDLPIMNGHSDYTKAAPLIPRRRRAHDRRNRWAKEYQGVLDRHFERQRRALKSQRAKTKAITDVRWNTELGNGLNDVAERQFEAEGKHVAFRLASTFDPDYGQNWLAAKSINAAEAINRTTQDHANADSIDKAFDQAKNRAPAAAMAYATDIAAFSTKVAAEQAPGEPTVIIDGGECEVCAPFQGSWPMSELEQWPAYHANCVCVADVMGGVPEKGIQGEVKVINQAQTPTVEVTPVFNFDVRIPEGVIQSHVDVAPPPPAEVYVSSPEVNVAPAMVSIEEGAFTAPNVNVQAPAPTPAPEVYIDNPITVEAPQPADVTIEKGAIQVSPADVNVQAPSSPDVNVTVSQPSEKTTRRIVRDKDGNIKQIVGEGHTQTIKRNPKTNLIESIEEE